jgi:hypothetical protein
LHERGEEEEEEETKATTDYTDSRITQIGTEEEER